MSAPKDIPAVIQAGFVPLVDGSYAKPKKGSQLAPLPSSLTASSMIGKGKRVRQSAKPLLNGLETEFLGNLMPRVRPASVRSQAKTYRLANGLRYTPDFTAILDGKETAWEVKGKWVDGDSFPKLKMAAAVWPEIRWILAWKKDGQWVEQEIRS